MSICEEMQITIQQICNQVVFQHGKLYMQHTYKKLEFIAAHKHLFFLYPLQFLSSHSV